MKDYLKTLIDAVTKRVLINPNFEVLDKKSLKVLSHSLKSPFSEEVIYFLQSLERIEPARIYEHPPEISRPPFF